MIDYREIIRLKSADYSNTSVASSTGSSRNKVADIWKKAQEKQIEWPIPNDFTNKDLKAILYPQETVEQTRLLPDYEYVYNELARPGVTLSLLWAEYCIKCQYAGKIAYQ
ncbi:MAG TPA: IS21 family transposase, partial [Porphyromonadaceae bacterium]|nr:IS21 family transposase [Porphyromonadaceae bacterium]